LLFGLSLFEICVTFAVAPLKPEVYVYNKESSEFPPQREQKIT